MLLGANPMWQPTVSIRAPSLHLLPRPIINGSLCRLNCDFHSPQSFINSVSSVPAFTTKWSRLVSFHGTCCWLWCHWNKFLFKESILSIKCNLCCLYMIGCVVSHRGHNTRGHTLKENSLFFQHLAVPLCSERLLPSPISMMEEVKVEGSNWSKYFIQILQELIQKWWKNFLYKSPL